ncbi:phosphopantetheine-binding protein, partial [Micromonospora sp. NPDC023956]|uniref:phosphopantetheine-binding protein n=1 Tax=Micromonospora sp. NPDC023956 TaxID=3155722 RepID=UPI0033D4787C
SLAGEPLRGELVRGLRRVAPGARVFNLYGPTEYAPACSGEVTDDRHVTIGAPGRTQLMVLDARLRPVPDGVVGEICLAGDALARGYLNRPGLTAERFVPNPFGAAGSRMYRTGDLGRFLSSGEVEFHGRMDFQVKVRGFRVELGEVEAALLGCTGVSEVVVTAVRHGAEADPRLVAYVVGDRDGEEGIRRRLAAELPHFMIPSAFLFLDALPLTPNGKVDRSRLPEPDLADTALTDAYLAPRTPLERRVADIWRGTLGVERVGVHDNFFALGGHSLLVVEVVNRMSRELGVEPTPRTLFAHPTVAEIADYVESRSTGSL